MSKSNLKTIVIHPVKHDHEETSRKITFGKIDGYQNGRKNCEAGVEVCLRNQDGKFTFSACAFVWNSRHTDWLFGGQCLDDDYFSKCVDCSEFRAIQEFWKRHHLNGMHAGTVEQEKALEDWKERPQGFSYDEDCDYLKSIGLYEVTLENGEKYEYGHGWLYRGIPEDGLNAMKSLVENGEFAELLEWHKKQTA